MPDHPAIYGFAGREIALSDSEAGTALLQPGFGLGDVGASQIANLEAVAVASRLVESTRTLFC